MKPNIKFLLLQVLSVCPSVSLLHNLFVERIMNGCSERCSCCHVSTQMWISLQLLPGEQKPSILEKTLYRQAYTWRHVFPSTKNRLPRLQGECRLCCWQGPTTPWLLENPSHHLPFFPSNMHTHVQPTRDHTHQKTAHLQEFKPIISEFPVQHINDHYVPTGKKASQPASQT